MLARAFIYKLLGNYRDYTNCEKKCCGLTCLILSVQVSVVYIAEQDPVNFVDLGIVITKRPMQ